MMVASFYAPRERRWGRVSYDDLLLVLDASCRRLGMRHVCISDGQRSCETAVFDLPGNLMQAILSGLTQFLEQVAEPVLIVGPDSVLTRMPPATVADIAVTVGAFADCEMNTGYMLCARPDRCAPVFRTALERQPVAWGDDQVALYSAIRDAEPHGFVVERLGADLFNRAPEHAGDDAGLPVVAHFRGNRKRWMAEWARRHVGVVA